MKAPGSATLTLSENANMRFEDITSLRFTHLPEIAALVLRLPLVLGGRS